MYNILYMAYKLIPKTYPLNFSSDITKMANILTFKSGNRPFVYGSSSYKINYPSDYDFAQTVEVNDNILSDFQQVIRTLLQMKEVYIGDIKSGEVPELKVVDDDINSKNYPSKRPIMIERLEYLLENNNITEEEFNDSINLLKDKLSEIDIYIIKHEIRFEVMRWKPQDILNGYIDYRGHRVNFYDYLIGNNLTKIDILAWMNGIRYNEITMVYVFTQNNIPVNNKFGNIAKELIGQIPYLLYNGKFMKVCKRINSVEKSKKNQNKKRMEYLFNLFNSDLGRLNQIVSDLDALEYLVENARIIAKGKFKFEIDQIRNRLGIMTNQEYIREQPVVAELLNNLQEDVLNLDNIDKLKVELNNILQSETLKSMKRNSLFPIPKEYLPAGVKF